MVLFLVEQKESILQTLFPACYIDVILVIMYIALKSKNNVEIYQLAPRDSIKTLQYTTYLIVGRTGKL